MAYTVDKVVSANGRIWRPGEPVPDHVAAKIDDVHLVPFEGKGQAYELGDGWYDGRTVKAVLSCVGSDPDRAAYALEQERARPPDRQRSTVFDALYALVGDAGGDTPAEPSEDVTEAEGPVDGDI